MTIYLSFRASGTGGPVVDGSILEADSEAAALAFKPIKTSDFVRRAAGKHVLFATHGFNVNRTNGVRSLGRLEAAVKPLSSELFVGTLWPGDFWLPVVNYPFEGSTAIKAGEKLAIFCNNNFSGARSLSFVSHSLGARVVLEAVANLNTKPRFVCLTAGAINDDCLSAEYRAAAKNCDALSTLSSERDHILRLAYPVGDLIADVLHQDHAFGERALGRDGPKLPIASSVAPSQIANDESYDHSDYLPPGTPPPAPTPGKWAQVADYISCGFRGATQNWP